jgi:hypothetical protein
MLTRRCLLVPLSPWGCGLDRVLLFSGAGENRWFGSLDAAMVVRQHCDLLEYVMKATREELDVLEIWWGGDVLFGDGRCGAMYITTNTFYFLVNILLKSGWMLPTSRRSLLGV